MHDLTSAGVVAAATLLRELLTTKYQRRWMIYVQRRRGDGINFAAVSQVVALYLWECGLKSDTDRGLPRKLRDRIRQALLGEQLTPETITWVTEAFSFTPDDAHRVWDAFAGKSFFNLANDGIAHSLRELPVPLIAPQNHRTMALFSQYFIGSDHMLQRIETSQVLVAQENGIQAFAYSPRDTTISAEVVSGGTFFNRHESAPGFVGLEFRLDRPLLKDQHTSLQYFTIHGATSEPCTQVRRAARKRIDNVDMRVVFEGILPKRAWWSIWDAYSGGNETHVTPVDITHRSDLHQFVPYIEEAVIGFKWEW